MLKDTKLRSQALNANLENQEALWKSIYSHEYKPRKSVELKGKNATPENLIRQGGLI